MEGSGVPGRAAAPVTLRVLGTLEAVAFGVPVRLGGPTQRAVLARILVAGSVPVSAERGGEDVDRLGELQQRYPLREPLAARLVLALYAAGRQADALAAYERCRRVLADQLGVDPAPPLRRVHAAVLAQEALGTVTTAGP